MLGRWGFLKHQVRELVHVSGNLDSSFCLPQPCCGTLGKLLYFSGPQLHSLFRSTEDRMLPKVPFIPGQSRTFCGGESVLYLCCPVWSLDAGYERLLSPGNVASVNEEPNAQFHLKVT